jgi:hypothetical protein
MTARCLAAGLALSLGALACADIEDGSVELLLVPAHLGRNQSDDPFALVERLSLGLLDEWGGFSPLGEGAPGARLDLGLFSPGKEGCLAVMGKNDRGRPVSFGASPSLRLESGERLRRVLPFFAVAMAPMDRLIPGDEQQADPFRGRHPSLTLGEAHIESGSIAGPSDLSALATLLWSDTEIWIEVRVRDDQVSPAGSGLSLTQGDAVRLYLDGNRDGPGGADDFTVTVSADDRVEPPALASAAAAEAHEGGYRVQARLPFSAAAKNAPIGFDLRVYDFDGVEAPTRLTWAFDPRQPEDDPQPDEYGDLVPLVPLLPALAEPLGSERFDGSDGPVAVSAAYLADGLAFTIDVPDGDVRTAPQDADLNGSDRVEILLDLANGRPPIPESARFYSLAVGAGGSTRARAGADPQQLSPDGARFTGSARGTLAGGGYRIQAEIPFADLSLAPQPGWFLGLDVRVMDVDEGSTRELRWSGSENPGRWPELRLWHRE